VSGRVGRHHIMSLAHIEQAVVFGPFQMPRLQGQVNEEMRQAFYSYLAVKVMPLLEGEVVRIDGRVFSHYDRPEFAGLAEVRHRYYYEIRLSSEAGDEEAWGEVDYHPQSATYSPSRIKPPCVRTLSEKRNIDQQRQAELEFQQRNAHHGGDDCPRCHSKQVARLVYGLVHPTPKIQAELDAGRIRLGGCCISEESRKWCCLSCECSWGLLREPTGNASSPSCC
jgi:hypothetical protein